MNHKLISCHGYNLAAFYMMQQFYFLQNITRQLYFICTLHGGSHCSTILTLYFAHYGGSLQYYYWLHILHTTRYYYISQFTTAAAPHFITTSLTLMRLTIYYYTNSLLHDTPRDSLDEESHYYCLIHPNMSKWGSDSQSIYFDQTGQLIRTHRGVCTTLTPIHVTLARSYPGTDRTRKYWSMIG